MAGRRDGLKVQVNGRGYETDPGQVSWQVIPVARQGVDQGAGAGESSLSNEIVWLRARENLIDGAGQENADLLDNESARTRFYTSREIDTWTKRRAQLHHATARKLASSATNLRMVVAGDGTTSWIFIIDGTTVKKCSNPTAGSPTWTTITAGAGTYTDITTDGRRVWVCNGSSIYYVDANGTALTELTTEDTTVVGYANGRLLGAHNAKLFEVGAAGAITEIWTHTSPDFDWDGIIESPAGIYVFGHNGDKTQIFIITAVDATGGLDVPFFAGGLPDGQILRTMAYYVGVMILASDKGLQLAQIAAGGFLSIAPYIDEPGDVRCIEPQGDDVWFGWSTYDATHSGLGRARLSRFTDDLVPAFASDIMALNENAAVLSVVTHSGRRFFTISGDGVWGEELIYPPDGDLDLGYFSFGIPEPKMIDSVTIWHDALPANTSIRVRVYADDNATPILDGTSSVDGARSATFAATTQTPAERYHVTVTLATTDSAVTPVLRRVTLRAAPKPFVPFLITLPLALSDRVDAADGVNTGMVVLDEYLILQALVQSRQRFTLTVGGWTGQARLESVEVRKGGLGGANGIDGWDRRGKFFAGKWDAAFVTLEPVT